MGGEKTQLADVAEHLGGISFVYCASSAGNRSLSRITPAPLSVCSTAQKHPHPRISCVYRWKSESPAVIPEQYPRFGCKSRHSGRQPSLGTTLGEFSKGGEGGMEWN